MNYIEFYLVLAIVLPNLCIILWSCWFQFRSFTILGKRIFTILDGVESAIYLIFTIWMLYVFTQKETFSWLLSSFPLLIGWNILFNLFTFLLCFFEGKVSMVSIQEIMREDFQQVITYYFIKHILIVMI